MRRGSGSQRSLDWTRDPAERKGKAITGPLGLQVRLQIRWSSPSHELQWWKWVWWLTWLHTGDNKVFQKYM